MDQKVLKVDVLVQAMNLTRQVGGKTLIDDVSIAIRPGQGLGLIGESGSGKSSLLRAIAMLDPLDAGTIDHLGTIIGGGLAPGYRRKVAYVSQRPAMIVGSVEDNLRLPFRLGISEREFDRNVAIELLNDFGRADSLIDQDASKLSGGEQQSVALVRTILANPQVLLLDEPTASLDPASTGRVEQFLLKWKDVDRSRAWIWTSHDEDQISRISDQVLRMQSGRLIDG